MAKIIDVFMFYQEIELLKIRIKYLNPFVDKFIILESCQFHNGDDKEFLFEKIINEFDEYKDKIIYYKIEKKFYNYDQIISYLKGQNDPASKTIIKNLFELYDIRKILDKNELSFLLDTYQREALHYALYKTNVKDEDLILISDLDEIPSYLQINSIKKIENFDTVYCLNHLNFSYFFNLLSKKYWPGTLFSKYKFFKTKSFNLLRMNAKQNQTMIKMINDKYYGYHFNSFGGIEAIKSKIKKFAHQEFNNKIVIGNIKYNISRGKDIFGLKNTEFKIISLDDKEFFDSKISSLIKYYENFIIKKFEKSNPFKDFIYFILVNLFRLIYKLKLKLLK